MLRIKLVRSMAGTHWRQNATLKALGLRKMQQTVDRPDNDSIRGMVHRVRHMVTVETVADAPAAAKPKAASQPAVEAEPAEAAATAPKAAKKPAAPKKTPAKSGAKKTKE